MSRRDIRRRLYLVAVALLVLGLAPITAGSGSATALTPAATSAVTVSKDVTRSYLDNGAQTVVDSRHVSFTVSQTAGLKSLQLIHVSWTGAPETGGIIGDTNSDLAQNEEHSFVVLECRGIDSPTAPAGQRLSPQTCWTQYADERFQYGYDAFPAWRSDQYADPSARTASVGAPANEPSACKRLLSSALYQYWVPYVEASGTVDAGGPFGCAGLAPEASSANSSNLSLPSNETFGVTAADGTGSTNFDIFTGEDHASLGCSQTVSCSLVAIPILGISCDPSGSLAPTTDPVSSLDLPDATANCETNGRFAPGSAAPAGNVPGNAAVDGTLWWSASNWRNRMSVQIKFAPADNACALNNTSDPVQVYGSELMTQATTQWSPTFCLSKSLFNFKHVQTAEPEARTLLNAGSINAAFTSFAPDTPYLKPTVTAPVAVTGFGVAFDVDDSHGKPVANLRLNARLLAKLMTESYPDQTFIKNSYPPTWPGGFATQPTLSNNPFNLAFDPEFQALNPGIPARIADAAATILLVDSNSDVIYSLTSYLNADPEARAWLDGQPDPWGMRVNPNYQKIALPVQAWPLLDTYEPLDEYQVGKIDCLVNNKLPWLPLVANPASRFAYISQDMEFSIAQTQTVCVLPSPIPGDLTGAKMVAQGRQTQGFRFMLGLVSLGDAARDHLQLASLESQSSIPSSSTSKFTDATGRSFVAPSNSSMQAAAAMVSSDSSTNTFPIPYAAMRTDPKGANAYPGTMVVYTAVPTSGLTPTLAKDYTEFLQYAAGPGQVPGVDQGQLPPGYLPMTSGDGLAAMVAYTGRAAKAVAAQNGYVPAINGVDPSPSPSPSASSSTAPASHSTTGAVSTASSSAPQATTGQPTPAANVPTSSTSAAAPQPALSQVAQRTPTTSLGIAGAVLPAMLVLVLIGACGAAWVRLRPGQRAGG